MSSQNDQDLASQVKKLRRELKWMLFGYCAFWTGLIVTTVILYAHHMIP